MTILLTHSSGKLAGLNDALLKQGFEVEHCPLIQIKGLYSEALDIVLLARPYVVDALPEILGANAAQLIALGVSTAARIMTKGWSCVQAENPSIAAILSFIANYKAEKASL